MACTVPAKDLPDLVALATTIRHVENHTRGVSLTAANLTAHGCEVPARRIVGLFAKYTRELSLLLTEDLGYDPKVYRHSAGERTLTGAGPFGRLGGTKRGQSKYHHASLFASTSKARTYPLPPIGEGARLSPDLVLDSGNP